MRGSWELTDGTRVEAKLVSSTQWSVRVNGAEVPSTTDARGILNSDAKFAITEGRNALITMRKVRYGSDVDLHVDGQVLLYPGRRPFHCPACSRDVRAYERNCVQCNAALPNRAQRVQELRRRSLFQHMLTRAVFVAGVGGLYLTRLQTDPRPAMAQLLASAPGCSDAELRELALVEQWGRVTGAGMLVALLFGLAFLSRRAPLTASALNLALWSGNLLYLAFARAQLSAPAIVLAVLFVWGAHAMFQLARDIRAAERSPHASDLVVRPLRPS